MEYSKQAAFGIKMILKSVRLGTSTEKKNVTKVVRNYQRIHKHKGIEKEIYRGSYVEKYMDKWRKRPK